MSENPVKNHFSRDPARGAIRPRPLDAKGGTGPFIPALLALLGLSLGAGVPAAWADPPIPTPSPVTGTSTPGAAAATESWTKDWMAKYVAATAKEGYVYVLMDAETMRSKLAGAGNHSAAAREALNLVHSFRFPENSSDLVKLDIVYFESRSEYGAPIWDTIKHIGHLEFSRKALAKVPPETFLQGEDRWKGLFQKVYFY